MNSMLNFVLLILHCCLFVIQDFILDVIYSFSILNNFDNINSDYHIKRR